MEYAVSFLVVANKFLVSPKPQHQQEIKQQLCSSNNRLIEKALTFVVKATRIVKKEDYENYRNSLGNPKTNANKFSYSAVDGEGMHHFNDLPPMYNYDFLECNLSLPN